MIIHLCNLHGLCLLVCDHTVWGMHGIGRSNTGNIGMHLLSIWCCVMFFCIVLWRWRTCNSVSQLRFLTASLNEASGNICNEGDQD